MSIPWGFYQGNRSEYLAIPALSKLGFTVPIPRQEDHFGVDFIVHLASLERQTLIPSGKSFGIQIKSNEEPLVFDEQHKRDCLYNSSLPFFLGVVSRENLTLTIYNTLNRLDIFWMLGSERDFRITYDAQGSGIPVPDFDERIARTGHPILEISIAEPSASGDRAQEIRELEAVMESWIDLENENLSLKRQDVPLVFWPAAYATNKLLSDDLMTYSFRAYTSRDSRSDICRATQKPLTALSFYMKNLIEEGGESERMVDLMQRVSNQVASLKETCNELCDFHE